MCEDGIFVARSVNDLSRADPIKAELDDDNNLTLQPREDQEMFILPEKQGQGINMTVVSETQNEKNSEGYSLVVKAIFRAQTDRYIMSAPFRPRLFLDISCNTSPAVVRAFIKWKASESILEWAVFTKGVRFTLDEFVLLRKACANKVIIEKLFDTVANSSEKVITGLQMGRPESTFHQAVEEGFSFSPLQITMAQQAGVCEDTIRKLVWETHLSSERLIEDLDKGSMVDFVDVALRRRQKFTIDQLRKIHARTKKFSMRQLLNRNLEFSTSQEVVEALELGCERVCLEQAAREKIEFSPRQLAQINMRGVDRKTVQSLYSRYGEELNNGGWVLRHTFSLKTVKDLFDRGPDRFLQQVIDTVVSDGYRGFKASCGYSRQHASQMIVWLLDQGQINYEEDTLTRCSHLLQSIKPAKERLRRRLVQHLVGRPEVERYLCLDSDCRELVLDKLDLYDLRKLWPALDLPRSFVSR